MKEFIKKNFTIIVSIFLVLIFFKGCNDTREIGKIKQELNALRDSVATKTEVRQITDEMLDLKMITRGFMESQSFVLKSLSDVSIKSKSTSDAWEMYTNKIKELNK